MTHNPRPGPGRTRIELITAPSSLGLRPPSPGHQPGAWRAPDALLSHGLAARLHAPTVTQLEHPQYDFRAQKGTRIRNGRTIREYSLVLAEAVGAALDAARFPLVVGGDCSVLLGCLFAARREDRSGLVHVDGHSDFYHPNNYNTAARLGSVAGMDLALATGRGEPILTHWPHIGVPLISDGDAIQLGDREADPAADQDGWSTIADTAIAQLTIHNILNLGIDTVGQRVVERLDALRLDRIWLHVDLDVLDHDALPAVDSPGSPGLDFAQLTNLIAALDETNRVIGVDVTVYDPELDEDSRYATPIVDCLASSLASHGPGG